MNFCFSCSKNELAEILLWRGWPLRTRLPYIKLFEDSACPKCLSEKMINDASHFVWLNIHEPYNTGLPDYWKIQIESDGITQKWGTPYLRNILCGCGASAVLSDHLGEKAVSCPKCKQIKILD